MYSYPLGDKTNIQIKDLSFNSIVETYTPEKKEIQKKEYQILYLIIIILLYTLTYFGIN